MDSYNAKAVKGEGRGKKLGFPTINLRINNFDIEHGVYFVNAVFENKEKKHIKKEVCKGILHFGPKKTFNQNISIELYIKENVLDIFEKNVIINIVKKIREIKKFKNQNELIAQIKKDVNLLMI